MELALVILVIVVALVFDYINGFHDTANAIATCISTRALSVRNAILMAAGLNFAGAGGTPGAHGLIYDFLTAAEVSTALDATGTQPGCQWSARTPASGSPLSPAKSPPSSSPFSIFQSAALCSADSRT